MRTEDGPGARSCLDRLPRRGSERPRPLAASGLTDINGEPLIFSPHDFRRIFVTDAIMSGPPHIAQIICGHKTIDTTIG
ncbi:MAG: hypothetical protein ACLP3C_01395 [Mycobacterium sp.]|uniref:hypothetical protein n=1 Tax=Mycobacterium sp. TaxID=1785 RepID=UPI003F95928D